MAYVFDTDTNRQWFRDLAANQNDEVWLRRNGLSVRDAQGLLKLRG